MKVFISYGGAADQVTALRLQALGAANGLLVYVPPAYTRQEPHTNSSTNELELLQASDVVLGCISDRLSEACRQELNAAQELQKDMIVMAYPEAAQALASYLAGELIVVDPLRPDQSETDIVRYLRQIQAEQAAKQALMALGTLALGLMILTPVEQQ